MHSRTTAREILEDFKGERLDYWVTGYGTGGTLKGVARVLAQGAAGHARSWSANPTMPPLLASGLAQPRNADGSPAAGHPAWKPHPMQGWTPGLHPQAHRRRGRR